MKNSHAPHTNVGSHQALVNRLSLSLIEWPSAPVSTATTRTTRLLSAAANSLIAPTLPDHCYYAYQPDTMNRFCGLCETSTQGHNVHPATA
ncbi:hypothetical protein [Photobacterium sanguinicancri]|uniref:hypothetical protein n=1 Tax=Photobacterium sanguinicancri TaxID=875932 RepID=UPI0026E2F1CD|nr:hypothetical protein [Photobacterium sanguinicancri]MDO6498056.1 hypothetical protein [Photobacterium sanguinicancri]